MVFKNLVGFWAEQPLLKKSYDLVSEMLDTTEEMFVRTTADLAENKFTYPTQEVDKKVNQLMIEVRKKVLNHLTISPRKHIVDALVLIQVVIYLERIGDHCKNLHDLNKFYKLKLSDSEGYKELEPYKKEILQNFSYAKQAFINSDEKSAKKVMDSHGKLKRELDDVIHSTMENKLQDSREAVAIAVYARNIKRVNSHLQHLASTITNPFSEIGFSDAGEDL